MPFIRSFTKFSHLLEANKIYSEKIMPLNVEYMHNIRALVDAKQSVNSALGEISLFYERLERLGIDPDSVLRVAASVDDEDGVNYHEELSAMELAVKIAENQAHVIEVRQSAIKQAIAEHFFSIRKLYASFSKEMSV